jgi:hypothetical protein
MAVASGGGYFLYCQKSDTEFVTFVDITDSTKVSMDSGEYIAFVKANSSTYGKTTVRIQSLSNFDYNKVAVFTLSPTFPLLSNPYEREGQAKDFYTSISKKIGEIREAGTGRPQSSIYAPLVRELNRLANDSSKVKYMLVYSDLQENTDTFSLYKPKQLELLKQHPEQVRTILSAFGVPGQLKGVSIYFVYQPLDTNDEQRFLLMAHFLEGWLGEQGAQVHIGPNLTN